MTIETWLAFALASAAVVLIPGPNVILTVNYAIRDGKVSGWATVPGVAVGAFVGMTISLLGAGAILATSAFLFSLLKIAGAVYLIWMAYQMWTAPVNPNARLETTGQRSLRTLFFRSFLTSVLNPKGPIFYIAFVPQFVNTAEPALAQFAILVVTFVGVAFLNGLLWLFFASSLRRKLQSRTALRAVNRVGASFLFFAGIFTARISRTG